MFFGGYSGFLVFPGSTWLFLVYLNNGLLFLDFLVVVSSFWWIIMVLGEPCCFLVAYYGYW